LEDLQQFSARHDIPIFSIADLAAHRLGAETLVEEVAAARLPSAYAEAGLTARAFRSVVDGRELLALVKGDPRRGPLVRVHSECLTGDAFGSLRCDCGAQLKEALRRIGESDSGVLIYLQGQEGRGLGLANKIRAYALQDEGLDTVEANHALGFPDDLRDYAMAAQILKSLCVGPVRLLTNNPRKTESLRGYGVAISVELPLALPGTPHNARYLAAKRDKLGHRLAEAASASRSAA
jgi:3,4-dihydroxy 2-butanone 4-phosphate synthase/GTP cyclohydrolase II